MGSALEKRSHTLPGATCGVDASIGGFEDDAFRGNDVGMVTLFGAAIRRDLMSFNLDSANFASFSF